MGSSSGAYRPPQWSNGPAMVSVTQVPTQGQNTFGPTAVPVTPGNYIPGAVIPATGPTAGTQFVYGASGSTQTTYVFDAVLELEHEQRLEKTRHPVQTGADISSHAYLMPPRVVMYIGMSDAMDAYSNGVNAANQSGAGVAPNTVAPFSGNSTSKSVNAYQTMISLQSARQPLTVTTRLRTYNNMVITSVSPREDYKTITGLRMRVEFEQIFTALTASAVSSDPAAQAPLTARPDATQQTGLGVINPSAVQAVTQSQFQYPQQSPGALTELGTSVLAETGTVAVPGAGAFSSVVGQQALP